MALPSRAALVLLAASPVTSLHINPNVGGRSLVHGAKIAAGAPCLTHEVATFDIWADGTLLEAQHERLRAITAYRPGGRCDSMMRLGLEVAFLAHLGQTRKSGEPYITHPVSVAAILADSKLDVESVVSGLLHDTVEDTVVDFGDIQRLFGNDVRKIVEGETKVSKLPKMVRSELASKQVRNMSLDKQDEQMENLRSMFVAMAEDWRIVVVKLADRLHNMRTLEHMPPQKRISIARETLEIFAPLAHRLGMWSFRSELADLSLSYLFPTEFVELEKFIEAKRRDYQATLAAATEELDAGLANDPRLCDAASGESRITVTGRTKNVHSTWKKLHRRGAEVSREELDQVLDLVALRIVVDTGEPGDASDAEDASVCYHVLGRVHQFWTPLPRTLKDYISSPKPNGYRSLHTTVLVGTQPLEVQIRTKTMHAIAEYGPAAHWAYHERRERQGDDTDEAAASDRPPPLAPPGDAWLRSAASSSTFSTSITKFDNEVECAYEFMALVRQELLGTRVFVFTESGGSTRILNLARGATLGDAAAQLDMSLLTHVPLLSGSPASPSTTLTNGEIVSFVRRDMASLERAAELYRDAEMGEDDELMGADEVPAAAAAVRRPPDETSLRIRVPDASRLVDAEQLMASDTPREWRVCERCLPLPGDALVCTTCAPPLEGEDEAAVLSLMLHRAACECLDLRRELAQGERLIRPSPALTEQYRDKLDAALRPFSADGSGADDVQTYTTKVVVFTTDRPGLLLAVSGVVTSAVRNILEVQLKTWEVGLGCAFQYKVLIDDVPMLTKLMKELEELDDVVRVVRGDMDDMMHDLGEDEFWQNVKPP